MIRFILKKIARFFGFIFRNSGIDELYSKNYALSDLLIKDSRIDAVNYIKARISEFMIFNNREELWEYCIERVTKVGLFAEFGVYQANSLNKIAALVPKKIEIFGFDSFKGLSEDWHGTNMPKTFFKVDSLPKVKQNVTLIVGEFKDTLPKFLNTFKGNFSFIHFDCDTYESTKFVLTKIKSRIGKGTILIFDEYFGYPNWKNGEFKAFQELIKGSRLSYRYLGLGSTACAVLIL